VSSIANLRHKARRVASKRRNRYSAAPRGTVTLHPPRDALVNLSRRTASLSFVEPDEALRVVTSRQNPTKKRKEMHCLGGDAKKQERGQSTTQTPRDPITLEELGQYQFVFVRPGGSTQVYNVESLVDYMLSSGTFEEPISRIAFSDDELVHLDETMIRAGLKRTSLVEAKKDTVKYTSQKQAQNLSFGIDRMLGDIVAKMMTIVESPDSEDGQMELVINLFPEFEMFFQQLKQSDPKFAIQCAKNYATWIRGPPNKPTKNVSGLLKIVTGFIDAQGMG
jgi:hypothetical protein